MIQRAFCPLLLTALSLLAIPATAADLAAPPAQRFHCPDGRLLPVSFHTVDDPSVQAVIDLPGGPFALNNVPAASGARYQRGPVSLHVKDGEALFDNGRDPSQRCLAEPAISRFIELSGSVSYLARQALPGDATLRIQLSYQRAAGVRPLPLIDQHYTLAGSQVPIPFQLPLDRDLIGPRGWFTLTAQIDAASRRQWVGQVRYPVQRLHDAQPVDLILKPAAAQPRQP